MSALALSILPLIPGLIKNVIDLANAVRRDPGTPEETKAMLDRLSRDLQAVNLRVQAAELPNPA